MGLGSGEGDGSGDVGGPDCGTRLPAANRSRPGGPPNVEVLRRGSGPGVENSALIGAVDALSSVARPAAASDSPDSATPPAKALSQGRTGRLSCVPVRKSVKTSPPTTAVSPWNAAVTCVSTRDRAQGTGPRSFRTLQRYGSRQELTAELLMNCEEDRTLPAVIFGCCGWASAWVCSKTESARDVCPCGSRAPRCERRAVARHSGPIGGVFARWHRRRRVDVPREDVRLSPELAQVGVPLLRDVLAPRDRYRRRSPPASASHSPFYIESCRGLAP